MSSCDGQWSFDKLGIRFNLQVYRVISGKVGVLNKR